MEVSGTGDSGTQDVESRSGATAVAEDFIDADRCWRLAACLDLKPIPPSPGSALPPLWHWMYFLDAVPPDRTGPDGHRERGDFLPPIRLRRRMFAGGSIDHIAPLRIGMHVRRTSTLREVRRKTGSTGDLAIVTIDHTIVGDDKVLVNERQDLVYTDSVPQSREAEVAGIVPPAPIERDIATDPVLAFRFSALTFNSHRIHYDRMYARDVEGYRDLVVHGPMTAMYLAELARSASVDPIQWFDFRATEPIYVGETIRTRGERKGPTIELRAFRDDGREAMVASAGSGQRPVRP